MPAVRVDLGQVYALQADARLKAFKDCDPKHKPYSVLSLGSPTP